MTKKLVPFCFGEGCAAKVFALDGVNPHVAVSRVDHGVEHAGRKETLALVSRVSL